MRHTVSALVHNYSGVLMRVASLFSRRGFNIESLAVGITNSEKISRITIVVEGGEETVDQLVKQLSKLEDVIIARALQAGDYVSRQLVFIKVHADNATRGQIVQIVEIFRAKIIDVSATTLTIEITGTDEKVAALETMLSDYGVCEVVRTGAIAIERGELTIDNI